MDVILEHVAEALVKEFQMLDALGLVDDDGVVHCRDCGAVVDRDTGPLMRFACFCGWELRGA